MKYLVLVDNRPMGLYENQDEGWGMYFAQPYYPAMLFGSYNAALTAIAKDKDVRAKDHWAERSDYRVQSAL